MVCYQALPIKLSSVPVGKLVKKTWGEFTPDDVFDMAKLRSDVFFLEQKITEEELDYHDRDPSTIHLWFSDDQGMAGYLRIVHDDSAAAHNNGIPTSLGRMVVRKDHRGAGLASDLMRAALDVVGDRPLYLHGQTYVTSLYERFGFVAEGEEFEEAGIPHVLMVRYPHA